MAKKSPQDSSPERFPIVGVGASAGGFEALRRMLEAMPVEPGFAIVIVQHLARDKPSLAPELLSKYTNLNVCQVHDEPVVQRDHIYVIPPGQYLGIVNGQLQLSDMEGPRRTPVAIDHFFRALAKDQGQRAVGVILSGTGNDGTLGVKAIKANGGLVLAQDSSTAGHAGMPDSAIQSGVVDQVLSPEEIPEALVRFTEHAYTHEAPPHPEGQDEASAEEHLTDRNDLGTPDEATEAGLSAILNLLRKHAKRDFRNYKPATLLRRTRRRMCLHSLDRFESYVQFLQEHPAEIRALAKDLLISVTDFFRDREAWDELAANVIPSIVKEKGNDEAVRVWVAGCATGEEAYTVAMLMLEEIGRQRKGCALQVFASDIDKEAVDQARQGRYPLSIEADMSAERVQRFFTLQDGDLHYEVNKSLRETVIFADQNLIADPPFSRLDLICCRNVMIYLKAEVQQKLVALFHFALRKNGFLMLGTAETIGRQNDLFERLSKRHKIYRGIGHARHDRLDLPIVPGTIRRDITTTVPLRRDIQLRHLAEQKLVEMLAPAAVLIDRQWRILYINGDVNPYLLHQPGIPNADLLSKMRDGLRSKLRGAVHRAITDRKSVSVTCQVERETYRYDVSVSISLVEEADQREPLMLIVFRDLGSASPQPKNLEQHPPATSEKTVPHSVADTSLDENTIISQLEEELNATKDDLRSTIEQFDVSNEEFKASNEEVMSINEELQSTNEELETSKEELQSLNEELSTVNHQLASKVEELEVKHADLENLISATEVATVCLDTDLVIRWFTPAVTSLIRIKTGDIGRPLDDLQNDFATDDLKEVCQQVLNRLVPIDSEVRCHDGRTFIRRVVPYRADDHRIGGVVVTLVDISARHQREEDLRISQSRFQMALNVDGIGVLFFGPQGDLLDCNDWFLEVTGYSRSEIQAGTLSSLTMTPPEWIEATVAQLKKLEQTGRLGPYEKQYLCKDGRRLWMMLSGCRLDDGTIVVHGIDIGGRKRVEAELKESEEKLRMAASAARLGWYSFDVSTEEVVWSEELRMLARIPSEEIVDRQRVIELIHPDDRQTYLKVIEQAVSACDADGYRAEFRVVLPEGEVRWLEDRGKVVATEQDGQRQPRFAIGMVMDISERKQAERQMRDINQILEQQVADRTEALEVLQHITRAANEAQSVNDALRAALKEIASYNGWRVGHVWQLDEDAPAGVRRLKSSGLWYLSQGLRLPDEEVEADEDDAEQVDGGPSTRPQRVTSQAEQPTAVALKIAEFQKHIDQITVSGGEGLIGRVMESGEFSWVDDIALESDLWQLDMSELGLHAAIAFPITIDTQVVAVMEFFSQVQSGPQRRFLDVIPDIGIQLGHVIQRKHLERIVAEIASEEQQRIGRELHDGIAQQLTGGALIAESLRRTLPSDLQLQIENVNHLIDILRQTHLDVRHLCSGLMPSSLDAADLLPAIRRIADELCNVHEIVCEVDDEPFDESFVQNDGVAFAVFQIAREATHNAVKHAQASRIDIRLAANDDFKMTIEDNGIGFDVSQRHGYTNGLRIMRFRVASVGGELQIDSSRKNGTRISVTIPKRSCQR